MLKYHGVSSTARFTYQVYKPRPKPTPTTQPRSTQLPTTQPPTTQPPTTQPPTTRLPTTSPYTCPGMPGTHHPLIIFHTLTVADTLHFPLADPCHNRHYFCSNVSDTVCSLKHHLYIFKQDCCCRCSPSCAASSPHC